MSDQKILNPETNRYIKINGPTYKKLVSKGVLLDTTPDLSNKEYLRSLSYKWNKLGQYKGMEKNSPNSGLTLVIKSNLLKDGYDLINDPYFDEDLVLHNAPDWFVQ